MGFRGGSKLGNGNHSTHPSKLQASSGGTIIHLEEFALEGSGLDLAESEAKANTHATVLLASQGKPGNNSQEEHIFFRR